MKLQNLISRLLLAAVCTTLLDVFSYSLTASPVLSETVTINIGNSKGGLVFDPAVVTVKPGDTLHFVVTKILPPHNVIFETGNKTLDAQLSHKALMNAGESFDVTIPTNQPSSTLKYFCLPHRGAGQVGKIVVVP